MKKLYRVLNSVIVNDENVYNDVNLRYVDKGSIKEEEYSFQDFDLFYSACSSISHSFAVERTIFNNVYLTLYRIKLVNKKKFEKEHPFSLERNYNPNIECLVFVQFDKPRIHFVRTPHTNGLVAIQLPRHRRVRAFVIAQNNTALVEFFSQINKLGLFITTEHQLFHETKPPFAFLSFSFLFLCHTFTYMILSYAFMTFYHIFL